MDDVLLANKALSLTQPIRNAVPVLQTALNAKVVIPAKSVETIPFSTNLKKYAHALQKRFWWTASANHAQNTVPLVSIQPNAQYAIDPISLKRAYANSPVKKVIFLMSLWRLAFLVSKTAKLVIPLTLVKNADMDFHMISGLIVVNLSDKKGRLKTVFQSKLLRRMHAQMAHTC